MKAEISAPKAPQVKAQSLNLDLSLRYLSGGGAGYAPVKVRAVVRPKMVNFRDYDGFTFANGKVAAGIEQQGGYQWFADEYELDDLDAEAPAAAAPGSGVRPLKSIVLDLDATGSARVSLPGLPASESPQELNAEMEYSDPNGEVLTTSARVALWPSKVILGIKPDSWALSQDQLKFQVIALDLAGKPVKNQQIKVQLYVRNMFTHRKRLVGGFYGYESGAEVKLLDVTCAGKTDERGRLFCAVKPPVSGNIVIAAETTDRDGNLAYANGSAWVAGKDAWWFDQSNDDRIDVIPERKHYQPGETAQFQVRMPFQRANALVTVEREGVVESFVQLLSGDAPVVKVPIKGNYAPNVFVSVLVVRGRIADVQPTALVDLGKPAFKMGVAEISVGWRAHELGVKVSAARPAYQVREKARVSIQVTQRAGGKPVPVKSGEVVIAAVDEGLLELGESGLEGADGYRGDHLLRDLEPVCNRLARCRQFRCGDFPAQDTGVHGHRRLPANVARLAGRKRHARGRQRLVFHVSVHFHVHDAFRSVANGETRIEQITLAHQQRQAGKQHQVLGGAD